MKSLFNDYRSRLIGRRVKYRRLAANSLLVYIDGEPGSETGLTFWLEPTWHFRDNTKVLTGSSEARHDPILENPDEGFHRAANAVDKLIGRKIEDVIIEDVTGDLIIKFDKGYLLRTFVSDPTTDELWHIRDNEKKEVLHRSGYEFLIRHVNSNK